MVYNKPARPARPTTLRIGLDLSPAAGHGSRGLARLAARLADEVQRRGRVDLVRLSPAAGRPVRLWRHLDLPRRAAETRVELLHSFTSAYALAAPCKRVQTVHELPWLHGERENAGLAHRFWAGAAARHADLVATATEMVAHELRSSTPGLRIAVVPWGVDPAVPREAQRVRALGLEPRRFVLVPGGARAKKRAASAVAAQLRLGPRGLPVVATGEPDHQPPQGLRLLGAVADEDMEALLEHAACVVVPSMSEGYSLPVLEALARGTPVVVPRGSAQAEAAGAAGVVAASREPDDLAAACMRAFEERDDPSARDARLARAAERSWTDAARRLEDAWLALG